MVCCAGQTIVDSSLLHSSIEVVEEVGISPGNGFIARYARAEPHHSGNEATFAFSGLFDAASFGPPDLFSFL